MTRFLTAVLFVELGDVRPRQRRVLRRELSRRRWRLLGNNDLVFIMQIRSAGPDRRIVDRATRNVHDAVRAASIWDWTADCILVEPAFEPKATGSPGEITVPLKTAHHFDPIRAAMSQARTLD